MSRKRNVPWWESLGVGADSPAGAPEPADLGTAFGLDASFATTMGGDADAESDADLDDLDLPRPEADD
jgi:hypothetical protein